MSKKNKPVKITIDKKMVVLAYLIIITVPAIINILIKVSDLYLFNSFIYRLLSPSGWWLISLVTDFFTRPLYFIGLGVLLKHNTTIPFQQKSVVEILPVSIILSFIHIIPLTLENAINPFLFTNSTFLIKILNGTVGSLFDFLFLYISFFVILSSENKNSVFGFFNGIKNLISHLNGTLSTLFSLIPLGILIGLITFVLFIPIFYATAQTENQNLKNIVSGFAMSIIFPPTVIVPVLYGKLFLKIGLQVFENQKK